MRHFITLAEVSSAELEQIFSIADDLKAKYTKGTREPLLPGRVAALLFEKPSLRTRVSFEAAIAHLGGTSIFLGKDSGFGNRESIADFSRVLGQYVDVIIARTFEHQTLLELARHCGSSVINGLSNQAHPCQVVADLFTLRERVGRLQGHKLAFVGDGNNVARSLARGCALVGMKFVLAAPEHYHLDPSFLEELRREVPEAEVEMTADPVAAVRGCLAVYTDVWASMGQEAEQDARCKDFAPYQVNEALMAEAPDDACFMHCLPARRGEEVTDAVIDGPQSIVITQAGNRMHAQKGLLAWLLASKRSL